MHQEWESGEKALAEALELETKVTRSIRNIIIACENSESSQPSFNDYHVSINI